MSNQLVSAVIPVYNGERYLSDAIASVHEQTYTPIEIVVVDDGSTDASADVVKRFDDVRLIIQKNAGAASARNKGVQESNGELIAFLDHDDCWDPDKTALQVEHLNQHPEIGFVLGSQRIFLEPDSIAPSWLSKDRINKTSICAGTGTMMVRRDVFTKVGPFDSTYVNGEDTDWFVRAVEIGIGLGVVDEATILRRFHGANATYNSDSMRANLLKIMHAAVRRKRNESHNG